MLRWHIFPSNCTGNRKPGWRDQRGIALIMAIVSVFLLTVAILNTRAGVNLVEEVAVSAAQEKQALYMARSGLAIVQAALVEDDPEVDSYKDDWAAANDIGAVPIAEVGWATGKVSDEEGKFNVLDLVNSEGESDDYSDFAARRLNQLLIEIGVDEDRAEEIVDSLIDWMDLDNTVTGSGGEDLYYESLDNPYPCPDDFPSGMDDLSLVKGIGPVLLYQGEGEVPPLIDFITIYGDGTGDKPRRININTAPIQIIQTLSPDIDPQLAEEIVASRDAEPFQTPGEIEDVPGFPDVYNDEIDLDIRLSDLIKVKSAHFSARITGETAQASSRAYGVFKRSGETVELVYYRGF